MRSDAPAELDAYFDLHGARFQQELFDFLRIPSVSARPEHQGDMAHAAEWLAEAMRAVGLSTEIHSTAGHPIVLGERRQAPGAPTVLVYGHYDVQPPEPIELWTSPPFEPTVRDGRIYARGATDDKGQLFVHLKAIEALIATRGELPVNVVVIAEGEEEIGSAHLAAFLEQHKSRLAADAVVISDSTMYGPDQPALLCSARGIAYFQIDVEGPIGDLHSGTYGGAVVNPATALARILATLHDDNGRVAVPGFYDRVREWPATVSRRLAALPFDEGVLLAEAGVPALGGEAGYSVRERLWTRPTCDVHGLLAGYTGEGMKTVLPARAMAKVSCRLVGDQDPDEIARLFETHVASVTPTGVRVKLTFRQGCWPWRADLEGPWLAAANRALSSAFGRAAVVMADGGSLPVLADFERLLNAPILLMGFGLPGENAHAPDEWLLASNFERGIRAVAALWQEVGRPNQP